MSIGGGGAAAAGVCGREGTGQEGGLNIKLSEGEYGTAHLRHNFA